MNPTSPSEREQRILTKVEQLVACNGDYRRLADELAAKRLAWWEESKGAIVLREPLPRRAYVLVLLTYMGIHPDEAPVIYEDEFRITWRSRNFCPLLEACQRLGLDTRIVCRQATEWPVQALIACLDPRLRFSRNYADGIRPYTDYCEESIELVG